MTDVQALIEDLRGRHRAAITTGNGNAADADFEELAAALEESQRERERAESDKGLAETSERLTLEELDAAEARVVALEQALREIAGTNWPDKIPAIARAALAGKDSE